MSRPGGFVLVADAADLLGVSQQRIRALLASGDLVGQRVANTWVVDPHSLADYRHGRQTNAGRRLAPVTAWAALLTNFATAGTDDVIGAFGVAGQRRRRVRALADRDVDDWRWLARRRCTITRFATRSAYVERIANEPMVIPAGQHATDDSEVALLHHNFDAYVDQATLDRLIATYRLRPDTAGNLTLRVINLSDARQLAALRSRPLPAPVAAVDMIEDRDPRVTAAGRSLLLKLLDDALRD